MKKSTKFVCIHGHFYQPPRENAWLEVLETQDSAAPFHDWNERINFECYAPNARARMLDGAGYIRKIVNNYARMSFNFGPTLLSWMEQADPQTYAAIQAADAQSRERFNGHGSALAQVYNHLIMPLANARDKETQTIWGIADFQHRFGRQPEGIWLAETAVDTPTLEVLAQHGILFTVLAPRQAKAVRPNADADWIGLPHAGVDPRRPYLCKLPSGKTITLFFYDGQVSQGVAFEGLLNNGKAFAARLMHTLDNNADVQIAHMATDGESYGHHHAKGEMALADCLETLDKTPGFTLANYAAFLELHPATWEVQIHENSSWSCVHGVERWRSNCGCNSGGRPGWNQNWRAPLRATLDWLRDSLIPVFEEKAGSYLSDVWAARNAYIRILLDRGDEAWTAFQKEYAKRPLSEAEQTEVLRLLEMQRHAQLMYTSCGWFFDEVSGLETNQILQYANRAIYYARQVSGIDLHPEFLERLATIPSNVHANCAASYQQYVEPARVDLERVAMHFATASIFERYPDNMRLFNYDTVSEGIEKLVAGDLSLVIGRVAIRSRITRSLKAFSYAALHLGQQNIIGNISTDMSRKDFDAMQAALKAAFSSPDLGQVIGLMQQYLGSEKFSIWKLFSDEQRKVLGSIAQRSLHGMEADFRDIYNSNYQLMTAMLNSGLPLPDAYRTAIQYVLNQDLHRFFTQSEPDLRALRHLVAEFQKWDVQVTQVSEIKLLAAEWAYRWQKAIRPRPDHTPRLLQLVSALQQLAQLKLTLPLWKSQDLYYERLATFRKSLDVAQDEAWQQALLALGEELTVKG